MTEKTRQLDGNNNYFNREFVTEQSAEKDMMGSLHVFQLAQSNRQISLTAQKAPLSPEKEPSLKSNEEPSNKILTTRGGERGANFAEKSIN